MKSNKSIERKARRTKIFFLVGSLSDLAKIEFSSLNIKCLNLDSKEFKEAYEEILYEPFCLKYSALKKQLRKGDSDDHQVFALLQMDLTKEFVNDDFLLCFKILLVMFPSNITIIEIMHFTIIENKFIDWDYSEVYNLVNYDPSNFLYFDENSINEINDFIRLFIERMQSMKYIFITIDSYANSFNQENYVMAFLNLCISLESITNGTQELNYRIARNVALLIADRKERALVIFENVKKIYNLRSKIIHGSQFDFDKVRKYLPYLEKVASRMIIELILQGFKDMDELNNSLTFAGFETKKSLSDNYNVMDTNYFPFNSLFNNQLQ